MAPEEIVEDRLIRQRQRGGGCICEVFVIVGSGQLYQPVERPAIAAERLLA